MRLEKAYQIYVIIGVWLAFLMLLGVFLSFLPISKLAIFFIILGLSMIKATLVALYYMHLKFEKILFAVIFCAPLFFTVVLTLLLLFDIRTTH